MDIQGAGKFDFRSKITSFSSRLHSTTSSHAITLTAAPPVREMGTEKMQPSEALKAPPPIVYHSCRPREQKRDSYRAVNHFEGRRRRHAP